MKKITIGILAHVDSGKTTLSEAVLYESGKIRSLGRVDYKNTYLDTNKQERDRGITIFSKQAIFNINETHINLIDTPGHIDFSAETERSLCVLDYAILVISARDSVQSHSVTLWEMLKRYNIPCFIFVNKMDIDTADRDYILNDLKVKLSENCVDFSGDIYDELALCSEDLMEKVLSGNCETLDIAKAISKRNVFPCFFGSALKNMHINKLMNAVDKYSLMPNYSDDFSAKVYKITWDLQGNRLTHMKITGGFLEPRMQIEYTDKDSNVFCEKINQIRLYSSDKFTTAERAVAGDVCTVTGLSASFAGMGLGNEANNAKSLVTPVLSYQLILPMDVDLNFALSKFRILEQEDPQLQVFSRQNEIHIQLMGDIQLEILKNEVHERFGFLVDFDKGSIVYKETIAETVYGAGHFEPLRHYAEVHLKLEPLKKGEGIILASSCSKDELAENWQNLILTHLSEKVHTGVLTNSAITDMKITIISGRAHLKHTQGGDFRQATYRALRQALLKAKSVLLEPYYSFRLKIPSENIGRAITDIDLMGGSYDAPNITDDTAIIKGVLPVYSCRDYHKQLIGYTKGMGEITLSFKDYDKCHNSAKIIKSMAYNAEDDIENTGHSVFCSHGAGYTVKWDESDKNMHIKPIKQREITEESVPLKRHFDVDISEDDLLKIFENTYGKIKKDPRVGFHKKIKPIIENVKKSSKPVTIKEEYLLVDGYNILFAWEDLKKIANEDSLDTARLRLMDMLCEYRVFHKCELILVFDAYKVKGNVGSVEDYNNIKVVYTKEAETADMYIEKVTSKISKDKNVRVATSDGLQQVIILGHGALRLSATAFRKEVDETRKLIKEYLENQHLISNI